MSEKLMTRNGFSLMEVLIVIAIMMTLLTISGISFNSWMRNYRLEGQVRSLYVDLMNARVQAMQKNHLYFVVVAENSYTVKEDRNDDGAADADLWTKQLINPSNWVDTVVMNTRGLVSPEDTITFDTGDATAAYDCITLSSTRIRMGKFNGTNCVSR